MTRPSILQLLAHGPATRQELAALTSRHVDDVSDAIWDQLVPQRLVEVNDSNVWCITAKGLETLGLAIEAVRMQEQRAKDAACEGVR